MRQDQITIGGQYRVRIGARLAPVTVTGQRRRSGYGGRVQTVYICLTGDTGRPIEATAARLRPMPGAAVPESRSAAADARRLASREAAAAAAVEADAAGVFAAAAAATGWASGADLRAHCDAWLDRVAADAGAGARADAGAAVLRSLRESPELPSRLSWDEIAAAGRELTTGGPLRRPTPAPGVGLARVSRRPIEEVVGGNLAGLRERVGRRHVAEPLMEVCRAIRRQIGGRYATRRMPRPLRRGLWAAVAHLHAGNRETYRAVMGHDPLPTESMVTAAIGRAVGLGQMPRG